MRIDLSNPQVLQNHIKAKVSEGKGEFFIKRSETVVFQDDISGMQFMVPEEMKEDKNVAKMMKNMKSYDDDGKEIKLAKKDDKSAKDKKSDKK